MLRPAVGRWPGALGRDAAVAAPGPFLRGPSPKLAFPPGSPFAPCRGITPPMALRARLPPVLVLLALASLAWTARGATNPPAPGPEALLERIKGLEESLSFLGDRLQKGVHEVLWFQRLSDVAVMDKVRYPGPPRRVVPDPAAPGASNEFVVTAYTFLPRRFPKDKLPLLVLAHEGVHGNVQPDEDYRVVRELIEQGYAVIAPDYRGSSGHGREYWQAIDYGGREIDDVLAGRNWMLGQHPRLDPRRVGILGWSHGGLIALMNVFQHPEAWQVAYAGVPVSDLVARMGYMDEGYRRLFSAPYHLGQTVAGNEAEYRRRSPAWNAAKLQTPLLIHSATNDEDVRAVEVEHLVQALQAAGKRFEHRVYTNAPGGHLFNRLDTPLARESRREVYRFLARHLRPPQPVP